MADAGTQNPLRWIGHLGTVALGVLLLGSGVASALSSLPSVLAIALVIFGGAAMALAWASWQGSRIGWAFAVTLDGVIALCEVFGSPKVAHLLDIPLPIAALPCALAAVACLALAMLHADYERAA